MGKRVLIVDDAAFMRMMLKDILTKNGYDVAGEAENGAVAVEKGTSHPRIGTEARLSQGKAGGYGKI